MSKVKKHLSIWSFVFSIIFGLIGIFMPPVGVIDNSVLIFIAQLLVFTSNILGFDLGNVFKSNKDV